jgi:hypothetical protein
MRIANSTKDIRLEDLNSSYAFSRGIVTAIIISGSTFIYFNRCNFWAYIGIIILLIVSLVRSYQRNGYYIKEVLNIAYTNFKKNN